MNDLETRLSDALDAAARTVPDTATGPGLSYSPAPHPVRRTLVVAIAAAAVVLAVVVPLAVRNTANRGTAPSGTGCPNPSPAGPSVPTSGGTTQYDGEQWAGQLPAGPPPRLPYLLVSPSGAGYLQDGDRRVPLAAGERLEIIARLGCDWLVLSGRANAAREVAVLHPDGSRTRRGVAARAVALSPDRTKIAFVAWQTHRIAVVDLASGRVVDSLDGVPNGTAAGVWSKDGIWYVDDNYHKSAHVWQPGSTPRKLTHDADEFLPVAGTDLVVLGETQNGSCLDVLKLTPSSTDRVMRHCGGQDESNGLVSPDGKVLMTYGGTAYRIPDDTATALNQHRDGLRSFYPVAWEDGQHVLLEAPIGMDDHTGREVVLRCDAISGSCERVYDAQRERELVIPSLQ